MEGLTLGVLGRGGGGQGDLESAFSGMPPLG